MTENEQIIKRIYEDGSFPLKWADKVKTALLKTEPVKVKAINYAPPNNDRTDIECTCPTCGHTIPYEYLDKNIHCENCGQYLTDWDELINGSTS